MKNNALRLSVSKIKCFHDCKRKYKFLYIDRLPRKTWSYHTIGKLCHKVLEDFHNVYLKGSNEPYNKIMSIAFKNAYNEYKADMDPEMKQDCWDMINQYLKKISKEKKLPNVLSCEQKFDFSITDKIVLNGMIDRVQIDDDNIIHVCDYKTVKNKKYLENDFFQLLTYAYVMLHENPALKKVRASYILMRHDFEYITATFKLNDILDVENEYISYNDDILNEKEYNPNPTFLCNYCDYLNNCPEGLKEVSPKLTFGEVSW